MRQCGDHLAETIFLKVPDGAQWGIELTKSNGKVWLQKGWPEFAEHYSLEHGSVLLFSSEGGYSHFGVQIFKRNTLEMNYPPNSSSTVEMNYASNSGHGDGDGDGDGTGADADAEDDAEDDADDDDYDAGSSEDVMILD